MVDLQSPFQGSGRFNSYPLTAPVGPFLFAWVDPTETTFGPEHYRVDESVFSFDLEHSEGEFSTLRLGVRNPKIGLLAPGRKFWSWFAYNDGTTITPLFFGRLVGVPSELQAEVISLDFVARPSDYIEQKEALAASLRVPPYWNPAFIEPDRREDLDAVLEARSQLYHIDRLTHDVSVSDVLTGEDGLIDFTQDKVFYDGVQINLSGIPLRAVEVEAELPWTQSAIAGLDLRDYLQSKWPNDIETKLITSFSGEGLVGDWPKDESNIGGGWEVKTGLAEPQHGKVIPDEYDAFELIHRVVVPKGTPPGSILIPTFQVRGALSAFYETIVVPLWHIKPTLVVGYDVSREYMERVKFIMRASMQPIITLAADDERAKITINSVDLSELIDGQAPIVDARRRSFLTTDNGKLAIDYLMMLARANLIHRARAVQVKFETQFENVLTLSCRKSGLIHDPRLPGGQATGKVVNYGASLDGATGVLVGRVTLGVAVGYGDAIATAPGAPTYVEDGYTEDYQERSGTIISVGPGDVGYTIPEANPNDDGVDFIRGFTPHTAIKEFDVTNSPSVQREAVELTREAKDEALTKQAISDHPTRVRIEFVPLTGGPFETLYTIQPTTLVIPQGIDLEAAT